MNFCVYLDSGTEIHGYIVPDGFSTKPCIRVRLNDEDREAELFTWVYIEGAKAMGAHETGNVGFVLTDDIIPGISTAAKVEIYDPETRLIIYRRIQPEHIHKKVLRLETAYIPHRELDLGLRPYFQFFECGVERFGFETIRQMLEIIHHPSVYVSGRILQRAFLSYISYNTDTTMVALRDPFYELASRIIVFSRANRQEFSFVSPRDKMLFKPVMNLFDGLAFHDEEAVTKAIRYAPKEALNLLASPFTQQLVASNPTDMPTLDDVTKALDSLSQFTVFDPGRDDTSYPKIIAATLGVPENLVQMKPPVEAIQRLADVLRQISRVEHLLEVDLLLYHFIERACEDATAA
ncbi:hypothetical protein BJF91_13140 [Allorhizobium taibaishanense]|uniref:Uncharacterized protein n=2 Tax=Allorhizobium taibaishanense TaxID=887144 RepID=A0A1Q9A6Q0_9HYPH|nr:hypothetical protein BJF91_13140 [Allorhizobium taibaishanense]